MDGKLCESSLEHMVFTRFRAREKDPVYAKQQLPMFGLNSRDPGRPQSSEQRVRTVAKTHESQKRFKAYERAEEAIKPKERSNNSPSFSLDTSVPMKRPLVASTGFRTSHYPKSSLTPELEQRVSILSAYKSLASSSDYVKEKVELCRQSPVVPAPRVRVSQKSDNFDLVSFKEALDMERRCPECKSALCRCVKVVKDDCLRKIKRRISKSRARIALRVEREDRAERARKEACRLSVQRHSHISSLCEVQSPPLRYSFMRRSLGGEAETKPSGKYFRTRTKEGAGEESLGGILQVSQASFSKDNRRRSKKSKFDLPVEDTDDSEDMNERTDLCEPV